ncbi:excalibur calcium-binding domain-containing protein [Mycobacteroides abscessus]|nr:excalibur calcium-binding domain-containing protein [Mycobacteroides abscessus]MDM2425889.1 excalibur calcium-binding domain-containing protein [Mycobacteroides abscessus]MDM2431512.1 excalibur calcium-binding domain-containing protein [Mycobacteroides abscessus]MDM2436202.1 excalibur calcium-binding domain-containing protein [Mycobacteroides abscessus]MDM2440504.1 excalibur calcium-binding domain-containing protein [Mycobacteroides abscessus]
MKSGIVSAVIAAGFSFMTMPLVTVAQADPPYKNCTEAHKDGVYNIKKGDPGYEPRLDRDGDGIACEPKPQ